MPPLFITLEGVEGCGKSTQARALAESLAADGHRTVSTREPGGTHLGDQIRNLLLDPGQDRMSDRVELLLYAAARAQHVDQVIRPALASDTVVICDRFADSTVAYQGYGLELDLELITRLNDLACGGVRPDLTFLLDLAPEFGLLRKRGQAADRIEQRDEHYHRRVREGYLALARQEPERIVVLNGAEPVSAVQAAIWQQVRERL